MVGNVAALELGKANSGQVQSLKNFGLLLQNQ
jgi:hypothetical protein